MSTICITGATDGIGLATTRRLLDAGHRVLVHARNEERGRAVLADLTGDAVGVTGDLSRLAEVRSLAAQIAEHSPLDVLVHNAGVWVRGSTPPLSADGLETTFAVNVLAPHLLTTLLGDTVKSRLIWLGSGMAGSGRPDPDHLGSATDPARAYADSKAADVALAMAWGRRLPHLASAAIDPGWVVTKLASRGAPGRPEESADSLSFCATEADLGQAPYWKGRRPISVPAHLRDESFQDALALSCDQLLAPYVS